MMYKCIVIDDEFPARELIGAHIEKFPNLELVGKYASPLDAMTQIQNNDVDILFLDIQMPDISGIDFINTLSNPPLFILTTAYEEYALKGYDINAVDYLLKPIAFDRFAKSVGKAIDRLNVQPSDSTISQTKKLEERERIIFPVKADGRIYKVFLDEILYIEGLKAYVSFYTERERLIGLYSMKELEKELKEHQFIRVHKSYIVNENKIEFVDHQHIGIAGKKIPIGQHYKEQLKQYLPWLN